MPPALRNLDGALFFDMATHEVLCLRQSPSSASLEFLSLIDDADHRWGRCIIFHRKNGGFKSVLASTPVNHEISLPYFDPNIKYWTLKER